MRVYLVCLCVSVWWSCISMCVCLVSLPLSLCVCVLCVYACVFCGLVSLCVCILCLCLYLYACVSCVYMRVCLVASVPNSAVSLVSFLAAICVRLWYILCVSACVCVCVCVCVFRVFARAGVVGVRETSSEVPCTLPLQRLCTIALELLCAPALAEVEVCRCSTCTCRGVVGEQ